MSATLSRAELQRLAEKAGPNSPWHELLKSTKPKRSRRAKAKDLPPSQGRTLKITVPMPDSQTNASGKSRGFWAKERARTAYRRMLDERAEAGLIPPPPAGGGFGRVTLSSVMYLGAQMDEENAAARHKWPIDWLQDNGYLVNDRYLKWAAFPTQIVKRGQDYRIELTLTEP